MIARAGLEAALAALAERRPVFHSEADFQREFARTLGELHPDVEVCCEHPVPWINPSGRRGSIDIWLREGDGATAIEIKYWTRQSTFEVGGERFDLSDWAGDLERYEFWKDVERTERLVAEGHAASGHVIALSNHQGAWNKSRRSPKDEAFRTHEGREVSGTLAWSRAPAPEDHEAPIKLRGRYVARWAPYSEPRRGEPGGAFRYLLLDAGAGLEAGR